MIGENKSKKAKKKNQTRNTTKNALDLNKKIVPCLKINIGIGISSLNKNCPSIEIRN